MASPLWVVNYTVTGNMRVTDTKLFTRLKDCNAFIESEPMASGFITRIGTDSTTLVRFFRGFKPSAQQTREIETITGLTWDEIASYIED